MMADLRGDFARLGDAYHQLFMGKDTDEAELAARHMAKVLEGLHQKFWKY